MTGYVDCIPCLFRQALDTARVVTGDPGVHERILREVARRLEGVNLGDSPAHLSMIVYDAVRDITGITDAYKKQKAETNREALRLVDRFEERVSSSDDPLREAVHLAAAGNVIDFGINSSIDVEKEVVEIMGKPFAVDDTDELREDLKHAGSLLYLGDNSGEIVFDRILVEQILAACADVTFAVKSGPILNDVTLADAETAGLTRLVRVIETGSADIGVNWGRCSPEFLAAFRGVDIIISKGQGNFETVDGRPGNVYFLLKAKCDCVASELGVRRGDMVFRHAAR